MKILYIHQYFKKPTEPGGTRSYWIARELLKKGHEVVMITGTSTEDNWKQRFVEVEGIQVIYVKDNYSQNMDVLRRIWAFLNFMFAACKLAFKQGKLDLVIATSTPLTIGVPALLLKWFRKVPYIFEVRDLWPDVPIQLGAIKNPILIELLRRFEKMIYKNANHVIALSPGMQEGVVKYIPKQKTSMIPNMSKKDEFWPREKNIDLMHNLGLRQDSFKIIHFGSLGLANGAQTIVESARLCRHDSRIEFIFLGGGSTERELKKVCKDYQLDNVVFLGKFPMKQTSEIVNFCDVSIVSFLDIPILYTNSPNKLFDSLSAGKPIIVNSAGWTKEMVEKHKCGFYVNPNEPQDLADKINYLKSNPEELKIMSRNSRILAEKTYDKSLLCLKFVEVVERAVGSKS